MRPTSAMLARLALASGLLVAAMSKRALDPTARVPAATRQRRSELSALGRESFVTHAGMAKLLKAVSASGLPKNFSTASQYRARKSEASTPSPYGAVVKELK